MVIFASDMWITPMKMLCMNYLTSMKEYPGGNFLIFNDDLGTKEHPEKIVKEYHITALIMENTGHKVEEYDKITELGYVIDNYLFISLYVRAFLIHQPFSFDNSSNKKASIHKYIKFSNEYFIISLIEMLFRAFNNNSGKLILDNDYINGLISTLTQYKNDITLFNPIEFSERLKDIERKYFLRNY